MWLVVTKGVLCYLWHKDQTQRPRRAKYDENGNDDERGVLVVLQDEIHSHPEHAHDAHVVERHAHVLGIVQGGNLHLACFPSQKGTKKLQRSKKGGHNSNDDVKSLVLFLLLLLLLSSHSTIFRDPFEARHNLSQQKKILRIILLLLSLWLCLMTEITSQSQRKKVFYQKGGRAKEKEGRSFAGLKKNFT